MSELILFTILTIIPIITGIYMALTARYYRGDWYMVPINFLAGWIVGVAVEAGFFFVGSSIVFLFTEYAK